MYIINKGQNIAHLVNLAVVIHSEMDKGTFAHLKVICQALERLTCLTVMGMKSYQDFYNYNIHYTL